MFAQLPWELQYLILRYLDIYTLTRVRRIDAIYKNKAKQILLAYHNPLDVMLCSVPLSEDKYEIMFTISNSSAITLDFIQRHPDLIDYATLSNNLVLTPDIIDSCADCFDWLDEEEGLSVNPALIGQGLHPQSVENIVALLHRHHQRINWLLFTLHQKMTLPIIEGVADYIIWNHLGSNKHLTPDIIEHYIDRLNLTGMLLRNNLTREVLITHHHRLIGWINVTSKCLEKWPELVIEYPDWPWTW